jgi:hypothetical protein
MLHVTLFMALVTFELALVPGNLTRRICICVCRCHLHNVLSLGVIDPMNLGWGLRC